jgi:DNA polymerase I-like protein with 3'-5' exonuclease and polymerase domains
LTMLALPEFLTNPRPEIYLEDNYVVLDFETTNHEKGSGLSPDNRIVLACWSVCDGTPESPRRRRNKHLWGGEFELGELVADIKRAAFVVAHNAKFELQWLERCGLDLGEVVVYDTMLAERVLGGNKWVGSGVALDKIAQRRWKEGKGAIVSKLIDAGVCPSEIPEGWLLKYCYRDVELTERLFLEQRQELAELGLLHIQYTRCLLTPVLADIEKNGMMLDPERVREASLRVQHEHALCEQRLTSIAGNVNWNSGPQVAKFLYETLGFNELTDKRKNPLRTPGGKPRTDADTISSLRPKNKKQRDFLAVFAKHREVNNELTKYLKKWEACCDENQGLLLAAFNQHMTQTHRLSSSGKKYKTQFQNFPRAYKPYFRARREGWLMGECDGAQLEFRVAVHLGRCEQGLEDIENEVDIHTFSSTTLTEAGEPTNRQEAKAHTFKPLYGGRSGTKAQVTYYQAFRDRYKGIAGAQENWINEVLGTKKLRTEYGLIFHWPDTRMDRSGYITNTTSICNYPVQGFATAEIIPIAVVFMWHRIRAEGLQMFIVNTIHDSIITELPEEEKEKFHKLAQQCLIDDVYNYLRCTYNIALTVPLGCGVTTGEHWGAKDETKYEARKELYKGG